jgi:hypothetical protein
MSVVDPAKSFDGGIRMNDMMAYCGLMCDECLAYKATLADSDEMRKATAEEWSRMFGADVKPELINCLGCRSGVNFVHCETCEIRSCAREKKLEHCGECDFTNCDKVKGIMEHAPEIRGRFESFKK